MTNTDRRNAVRVAIVVIVGLVVIAVAVLAGTLRSHNSTKTPVPTIATTSTVSTPVVQPHPIPSSPSTVPPTTTSPSTLPTVVYVVKPGDNLWDIAIHLGLQGYGGAVAIYAENMAQIGVNWNLIYAGERFTVSAAGVMTPMT
jgi:hypothetical protein